MQVHECDICIIGAGISSAMLAQKLSELRTGASIIVVEAGRKIFDFENRFTYRQHMLDYAENPWPGDWIPDQSAEGIISRTMAVGGQALHWGAACNRFTEEDLRLRSMYGLYVDWPIEWTELEKFYCEAERRLGVSGEASPFPGDRMSLPYPMPPMPLTWDLAQLKAWGEKTGWPFQGIPQAKNTVAGYDGRSICMRCGTCDIFPTGAKYSPDFTFKRLLSEKKIELHDETLIRRLVLKPGKTSIAAARGVHRERPREEVEYRAGTFVVASGYTWSSHLLLLSAESRFPNGLANRTGQVGKYMNGHAFIMAVVDLNTKIYSDMNPQFGLISRQFFRRPPTEKLYVRHDLRIWSNTPRVPLRLRNGEGKPLFGGELANDWRARIAPGTARLRAYYDVHPAEDSELTLDPTKRNEWGDPLPKIVHRFDAETEARLPDTKDHIGKVFQKMASSDGGKITATFDGHYLDHPAGGCRMGADAEKNVCDSYGRTHDHENLFVVGAPTLPTAGCTNGTLTFAAVTLRSAEEIAKGVLRKTSARPERRTSSGLTVLCEGKAAEFWTGRVAMRTPGRIGLMKAAVL
ncbi:MAG TPA: GMC family oxidoreductase [Candidatus Acidoferrales bacterium]|nr:GMC family oxidoreductase [Candidatus Acidoferrales bacterium]